MSYSGSVTSSETLHDYQRALIEKVFNTQIYDHYGTTERTIRLENLLIMTDILKIWLWYRRVL